LAQESEILGESKHLARQQIEAVKRLVAQHVDQPGADPQPAPNAANGEFLREWPANHG
jgi:hypothetical protein